MVGMLEGKSALITGGGGGIGRAAALAFAREGAHVAVADLMAEAPQETVDLVNRAGGQAMSLSGNITSGEVVRQTVAQVVAAYGRLDCAFNNAGIAPQHVEARGMKTAEWPEESFDRMIAVNLKSVWLSMKYVYLANARPGWRIDCQHEFNPRPRGLSQRHRLHRRQAWRHWPDQNGRTRICR